MQNTENMKYTKAADAYATHRVGPQGERAGMDNYYEWDTIAHSFMKGQQVPMWLDPNERQPKVGQEVLALLDRFPHDPRPYIVRWNGPENKILKWCPIPHYRGAPENGG